METDEEKEVKQRKAEVRKENVAGDAAYKKDFDTTIQHYLKALELDDEGVSFLTNDAAVYLEMGKV